MKETFTLPQILEIGNLIEKTSTHPIENYKISNSHIEMTTANVKISSSYNENDHLTANLKNR